MRSISLRMSMRERLDWSFCLRDSMMAVLLEDLRVELILRWFRYSFQSSAFCLGLIFGNYDCDCDNIDSFSLCLTSVTNTFPDEPVDILGCENGLCLPGESRPGLALTLPRSELNLFTYFSMDSPR